MAMHDSMPSNSSVQRLRKTVALVLGSGSSRGWAHIGAIEALMDAGIPIDYISGCSVGSYIGAIYASGGLASLKDFVVSMDGKKVFSYFDVVFPRFGLLDGKKVDELFSMHTSVKRFSELSVPVTMVATDLQRGEKVVLKSGNLLKALRATMSVPGLFAPAWVKGRWLVDGGVVDPVPVGVARATEADVVIAVDLNKFCLPAFIFSAGQATQNAGRPFMTICMQASPQSGLQWTMSASRPSWTFCGHCGSAQSTRARPIRSVLPSAMACRQSAGSQAAGGDDRHVDFRPDRCGQIEHVAFLLGSFHDFRQGKGFIRAAHDGNIGNARLGQAFCELTRLFQLQAVREPFVGQETDTPPEKSPPPP
jgi:predicted acylesterase/phospholipase RssA